jgi:chitinase
MSTMRPQDEAGADVRGRRAGQTTTKPSEPRRIRRASTLIGLLGIVATAMGAWTAASAAEPTGCAQFQQPYAGDPAYAKGDKVTFNGKAYASTFAPNWWSPSAAPQYWTETSCGTGTPDPTPTPSTPNPTSTPTPQACRPFAQPYSGDPAYAKGDKVTFNGKAYASTFAPNWWSPSAAPQYWTETSCGTGTPDPDPAPTSPPADDAGDTPPATGTPGGLVFSPYKDIAQAMFWSTGYTMGTTAVNGSPTPLVGAGKTLQSTLPKLNTITLAFATGECGEERWAGVPGQAFADDNIAGLEAADYDYILGTGGAAGSFTCSSAAGMRTFIDRYATDNLIGVDFDIERGQSAADIRNQVDVATAVQDRYPDLRFSFTIATLGASDGSYGGVNPTGDTVVKTVLASGLRNYTINLMVMDYGPASSSVCVMSGKLCDMGKSAIQAVTNLRHSYPAIPLDKIELTSMIALNDIPDEMFTLQDVDEMTAYAVRNNLAGVHYWSLDRDVPCGSTALSNTCNSTPDVPALGYTKRFLSALGRL